MVTINKLCKRCPFAECEHPLRDTGVVMSFSVITLCPYYTEEVAGKQYKEKGIEK